MTRQRERFERTDVPTPSHRRNVISLVVAIVVFVAFFLGISHAWSRADSYSGFNESNLENAIDNQPAAATFAGTAASPDTIVTVLVLTTSQDKATLESASIIAIDETTGTSAVAAVPADLLVTTDAGTATLAVVYSESGGAACVVPASSTLGISFTHVFVAQESFWEAFAGYSAAGDAADGAYGTQVRQAISSDISNRLIDGFLQEMVSSGVEAAVAAPVSYPVNTTDGGDAGSVSSVDATQLSLALGLVVAA